MTVRELIEALQKMPLDDLVELQVGGDGAIHSDIVRQVQAPWSGLVVLTSEQ